MPSYQTGPADIDTLSTGARLDLGDRFVRRDWHVERMRETHTRVRTVTQVATGNWYTVWPDLSSTPEAPTVANLIEIGVSHWASIFGAMLPSVQVPVHASDDLSEGKRGARKRQRRVLELWRTSNINELSAQWGADYSGAGYAVGMAWADFGQPDKSKRNPYLMRLDPRHVYLAKDNIGNVTEVLVARKIDRTELENMWKVDNPDFLNVFSKSRDEDIEEWFWIDKERFFYAVVDISDKGRETSRNVVLVDEPNELGFVPAEEAVRPTFDGQRRGAFDQTIHIMGTMQRLMLLTIASSEEFSFPAIGYYDVANPEDFGPGASMEYLSSDATVDRLAPTAHFDVKDLISRLGEQGQLASVMPQQLFGEPGASITSARGIKASTGALDARLAVAHKQFERFFSLLSGHLLAMDETYCDAEKTILGDGTEDEAAEKYRPSRDVNGAWIVRCTYGIGAGSDPANIETRLHMHLGGRLISRTSARHELPFLKDPDGEELKIFREDLQFAIAQGIVAMAQQGDPSMAAKAMKAINKDELSYEEAMVELIEALTAAPNEQQAAGTAPPNPLEALQGAESLARGGIPGNAAQAPKPSLPPLGQLLGGRGGPRQVAP